MKFLVNFILVGFVITAAVAFPSGIFELIIIFCSFSNKWFLVWFIIC